MFNMSVFSAAILYSSLGLVIGVAVAALFFYAVTFSKMKHKNHQLRDACLLYQKQLTQIMNKNKGLEAQMRESKQRWEKDLAAARNEQTAGNDALADAEQQLQFDEERQKWGQESAEMLSQIEQLREEKIALEDQLKQSDERLKQERAAIKLDQQALQQELRQLRDGGAATAEVAGGVSELEHKLKEQQDAWKRAQQLFQSQVVKLKTDKKALETELVSQVSQAEREKQALEDEIELLTERMMKIQIENEQRSEQEQSRDSEGGTASTA